MSSLSDHADSIFRAAASSFTTFLSRSAPSSPTAASAPVVSARTHRSTHRDKWLRDSDEAAFPLHELTAEFYRLCGESPQLSDCPAFDCIEKDVARTFAGAGQFETQAARDRLRRVLGAYAMFDREVGYVQVSASRVIPPGRQQSSRRPHRPTARRG